MRYWHAYRNYIHENIISGQDVESNYWRDRLFVQIVSFFLPLAILAIIPGVILCLKEGLIGLAVTELLSIVFISIICFVPRIRIGIRKTLFIGILYIVSIDLIYTLGDMGPGLLYILACTFFTVLIFPQKQGYISVVTNCIVIAVFTLGIKYRLVNSLVLHYNIASWLTVSINALLLSWIVAILMPRLFYNLEYSYRRFKTVMRATSDTIWDWDIPGGRMVYNSGIYEMFGYTPDQVDNTEAWWNEKIHPDDREMVTAAFLAMFADDKNMQQEYRFLCADGRYKYVMNRASIMTDDKGQPVRMIGAIQDVSKIRTYIQEIEEQNERLKDIAWVQSHKVRGPLATIMGMIPLLKKDRDPETAYIIEGISQSCRQMDEIVKEITDKSEKK